MGIRLSDLTAFPGADESAVLDGDKISLDIPADTSVDPLVFSTPGNGALYNVEVHAVDLDELFDKAVVLVDLFNTYQTAGRLNVGTDNLVIGFDNTADRDLSDPAAGSGRIELFTTASYVNSYNVAALEELRQFLDTQGLLTSSVAIPPLA